MIQRKQTLFLLLLTLLGMCLLFIPVQTAHTNKGALPVCLVPLQDANVSSTAGHLAAVALNFGGLVIAFITILIFKKRELQLRLAYGLMLLWLAITLLITFARFVAITDTVLTVSINYISTLIGVLGMLASYMAARFIRRDIQLLKSAERIR